MTAKISFKKMTLVLSVLLSLVILQAAFAQNHEEQEQSIQVNFAPNRMLVKFHPTAPENVKAAVHRFHGGEILDVIPGIDVHVIQIPKNKLKNMIRAYRQEGWVEFVEPDYIATVMLIPNDPYFGKQWGMTKIKAPEAWSITPGSANIKIAICDTGIDRDHEDLAGKIVVNKNCTWASSVDDVFGHGTHVAGIAAAATNNAKGVAGVGFNAKLMNVKVLSDNGSGYISWIASGIRWAADNGAKVINLSLGSSSPSSTLESAVNYAWNKGCVLIGASGNNNSSAPSYPAYYTNCISVAATDQNDAKASFSNYGAWVEVGAPGVNIYSTLPNHSNGIGLKNYGSLSGTSMATPQVSGLAALLWATKYGTKNTTVRSRIEQTSDQVGTIWSTYQIDRINAYKAVR